MKAPETPANLIGERVVNQKGDMGIVTVIGTNNSKAWVTFDGDPHPVPVKWSWIALVEVKNID